MADPTRFSIDLAEFRVRPRPELKAGALRYFNAAHAVPHGVAEIIGGPLPAPLQAVSRPARGSRLSLAWRTPTETLLLCADARLFGGLAQCMTALSDWGCFVDQTGGLAVWEITGARTREVLARLGSAASMPRVGEARTSRMADLPVLAVRLDEATTLLLVDRLYAEHMLAWVEDIATDF